MGRIVREAAAEAVVAGGGRAGGRAGGRGGRQGQEAGAGGRSRRQEQEAGAGDRRLGRIFHFSFFNSHFPFRTEDDPPRAAKLYPRRGTSTKSQMKNEK